MLADLTVKDFLDKVACSDPVRVALLLHWLRILFFLR